MTEGEGTPDNSLTIQWDLYLVFSVGPPSLKPVCVLLQAFSVMTTVEIPSDAAVAKDVTCVASEVNVAFTR